jgi:hypothetical protein
MSCNNKSFASVQIKRATNAQFAASNIILASGEPGYSIDTRVLKIGDGTTTWSQLLPVNVSGAVSFPSLIGSNNIDISTVGNSYVISTVGLANSIHQHTVSDITDFNPSGFAASGHQHVIGDITGFNPSGHQHVVSDIINFNPNDYAPSGHQHVINDITDFNAGDYAVSGHQHTTSDITDFNNVYDTPIFDLGYISYGTNIDWAIDKQIQTGSLDGSPLTLSQGNGWPSTNISRDVLLELTVNYYDTSVSWPIVAYWYAIPPEPLPVAKHLILFRAMGTTINGHYLGSGVL